MTLGPLQFVVVALDNDKQRGQIARQLRAASDKDAIRVLDVLAIRKEADGGITALGASELSPDERMAYGAVIGGILGLDLAGAAGAREGAVEGAIAFSDRTFGLSDDDIRDIARQIPVGQTALFALYEHRWAVGLAEAVRSAGGVVISQGFLGPEAVEIMGAALDAADSPAQQSVQH